MILRLFTAFAPVGFTFTAYDLVFSQMFDSLTAVLTHYQMTMPTLRRALVAGKPITKGKFVGLVFVYA